LRLVAKSLETQIMTQFDKSGATLVQKVESVSETALMTLQENLKVMGQDALTRVDEIALERVTQLKIDFNEWIQASMPGLADKLVKEPVMEILNSQLMSRLGVASGKSRAGKALANEVMEGVIPPGLLIIRDQLIKQVPSLKGVLKDPAKILEVAKTFGIDITSLGGNSESSNSSSSSRW